MKVFYFFIFLVIFGTGNKLSNQVSDSSLTESEGDTQLRMSLPSLGTLKIVSYLSMLKN